VAPEPNEREELLEPDELPYPDYEQVLSALFNAVPLSALALALLELEKRLYQYAHVDPELLEMADEGLVGAGRESPARLGQALSSVQRVEGHLQVVGTGEWKATSIRLEHRSTFERRRGR